MAKTAEDDGIGILLSSETDDGFDYLTRHDVLGYLDPLLLSPGNCTLLRQLEMALRVLQCRVDTSHAISSALRQALDHREQEQLATTFLG
jgi:hypothetical protein